LGHSELLPLLTKSVSVAASGGYQPRNSAGIAVPVSLCAAKRGVRGESQRRAIDGTHELGKGGFAGRGHLVQAPCSKNSTCELFAQIRRFSTFHSSGEWSW